MKRVYLFCDNGMSTSMMAQRMQEVADKHSLPIECKAFSYKKISTILEENKLDCILIGPQTKFLFDEINKKYGAETPVMVIDAADYGMMDADKVLKKAIVAMKKFKNK
ncbi:PTS sugar transporter subunit IIB [uncultured Dubosiella sp.]|uniref:PTS sugar transporter subunit IIB n=1 Tax=uncultured Dubosiella sp. TaxID=1937011 RepID=UPI00272FACED|nr:PTS sugar transporter subunit IIB [uncultured Dubosiella sp.]